MVSPAAKHGADFQRALKEVSAKQIHDLLKHLHLTDIIPEDLLRIRLPVLSACTHLGLSISPRVSHSTRNQTSMPQAVLERVATAFPAVLSLFIDDPECTWSSDVRDAVYYIFLATALT